MKIKQLIILSLDIIFIIAIIYFLMNYKLYIVSSGSMEPYLKTNELILVKRHLNSYSVGDIICYNDESMKFPITHRIINIENDNYYTKGDYNNIADFYPTNIDNIIGILYMKDFLCEAYKVGFDNVNLRNILHAPYFVPEMKNIDELFKELQISRKHMAILIDEYGGFSGIVTIEDLIEEVMGDIGDEFDDEEILLKNINKNTFLASGLISINELNEKLHINLDSESDDYDTLGGFIIKLIGYIPKKDDDCIVNYKDIIFKIKEVNKKRIVKVEITINNSLEDK